MTDNTLTSLPGIEALLAAANELADHNPSSNPFSARHALPNETVNTLHSSAQPSSRIRRRKGEHRLLPQIGNNHGAHQSMYIWQGA